jgi:hypothetical protein
MNTIGGRRNAQFSDEEVLEYRRWADEGTMTHFDLARERGITIDAARKLLNGASYAHVPCAVPTARIASSSKPRAFSDEEVVAWRERYMSRRKNRLKVKDIVASTGFSTDVVQRMLTGKAPYDAIPNPVPNDFGRRRRRSYTRRDVAAMRLAYQAPDVSLKTLKDRYGGDLESIAKALLGHTYKDVPNPLPKLKESGHRIGDVRNLANRKLAPEVVLFMRLQYRPRVVSTVKLGRAYKVDNDTVHRLLLGQTYKEVPGILNALAPVRRHGWSDDDVLAMRRAVSAGETTGSAISKASGISDTTVYNMLSGKTYKHVPEAIGVDPIRSAALLARGAAKRRQEAYEQAEAAVKKRSKGRFKPIPIPKVRLPDHDERTDLIALRRAA